MASSAGGSGKSVTIWQVSGDGSSGLPGHVFISINTPDSTTWMGFGPGTPGARGNSGNFQTSGRFDVQVLPPGGFPNEHLNEGGGGNPNNWASANGDKLNTAVTIPLTDAQYDKLMTDLSNWISNTQIYSVIGAGVLGLPNGHLRKVAF